MSIDLAQVGGTAPDQEPPKPPVSVGPPSGAPALPAPPEKEQVLSVLVKALTEASVIFVTLTFIGGWSYLASYYKTFGLNPMELDISIPVVCTVAVYVLYEALWPLIVILVLILAYVIAVRRVPAIRREWIVASLAALLLTTATAGVFRGRQAANEDTLVDSPRLPNVAFSSKLNNPEPSCVDHESYGSMDCKLLLHFKGNYYFFRPVPITGVGGLNLYLIPDSELLGVHIQRGLDRSLKIE